MYILSLLATVPYAHCQALFGSASEIVESNLQAAPINSIFPQSGLYFGVHPISYISDNVLSKLRVNGKYPAIMGYYISMSGGNSGIGAFEELCNNTKSSYTKVDVPLPMLMISIEPISSGLDFTYLAGSIANVAASCNQQGMRVLIRWASEFNIPDIPWSGNPSMYIRNFQAVASAVKEKTSSTFMVWSPNVAYYGLPADSYSAYYPGDEYVDVVSLSLYFDNDSRQNSVAPSDYFSKFTQGLYNNVPEWNFYQIYAAGKNKPFILGETSAKYRPFMNSGSDIELNMKRSWWMQVFAAQSSFPLFRGMMWFNGYKHERDWLDMRLFDEGKPEEPTANSQLISAFSSDVAKYNIVFANNTGSTVVSPLALVLLQYLFMGLLL